MANEIINRFYSDHPWFGTRFDRQILPWKTNTASLSPLVSAAFDTPNPADRTQDILSYLASGELGKRYTFRSGYDQTNNKYTIQYNTGTDSNQNWEDYLTIDEGTGTISGNFTGFYPLIQVEESDGSPEFETNKIIFNSEYFYITPNSTGEPIINFRGSSGGGGEVNTASNIGGGTGLFAQKTLADLEFKSLIEGPGIDISSDANTVTISSTVTQFYAIVEDNNPHLGGDLNVNGHLIESSDESMRLTLTPGTAILGSADALNAFVVSGSTVIAGAQGSITVDAGTNVNIQGVNSVNLNAFGGSGIVDITGVDIDIHGDTTIDGTISVPSPLLPAHAATKEYVDSVADDFYGITVRQTTGASYRNINILVFNSDAFYVEQNSPNTDTAIVNFRMSSGETTTASNLGSGTGVFAQKVGNDLQFKSLVQGPGIKLANNSTSVTIENTVEQFYGLTVRQTTGGQSYRNISNLAFNTESFYIEQNTPNTDTAIVNFRAPAQTGYIWLSRQTANNTSVIDFTSLTGYSSYRVVLQDVLPVLDARSFFARASTNNGSSYDATAGTYNFLIQSVKGAGTTQDIGAASTAFIMIGNSATWFMTNTGAVAAWNGIIDLFNIGQPKYCEIHWKLCGAVDTSGDFTQHNGSGRYNAAVGVNAIRFQIAGNIATGTFDLYGLKTN